MNAIEKQKEQESLHRSIQQKIADKNDLLLTLEQNHKKAIFDYLTFLIAEKTKEREAINEQLNRKVKEIAAYNEIMVKFIPPKIHYPANENDQYVFKLLERMGGISLFYEKPKRRIIEKTHDR